MDLFEILLFALIAGSGLLSELFKKRRQEQMKRQKERSEDSASTPQTTESIDKEFEEIQNPVDQVVKPVFKDLDSLLEDMLFGKSTEPDEKESFERLTSLENRPAGDLYGSKERKTTLERQPSAERTGSFEHQRSREHSRSLEHRSFMTQGSVSAKSDSALQHQPKERASRRSSSKTSDIQKMLDNPASARNTILAAEILSPPVSKRKGPLAVQISSGLRTPGNV